MVLTTVTTVPEAKLTPLGRLLSDSENGLLRNTWMMNWFCVPHFNML